MLKPKPIKSKELLENLQSDQPTIKSIALSQVPKLSKDSKSTVAENPDMLNAILDAIESINSKIKKLALKAVFSLSTPETSFKIATHPGMLKALVNSIEHDNYRIQKWAFTTIAATCPLYIKLMDINHYFLVKDRRTEGYTMKKAHFISTLQDLQNGGLSLLTQTSVPKNWFTTSIYETLYSDLVSSLKDLTPEAIKLIARVFCQKTELAPTFSGPFYTFRDSTGQNPAVFDQRFPL